MSTVKVSMSLTRNYGAYSPTWGAEVMAEVNSRADLLREYAKLQEHIHAAILDFEANMLTKLPASKGKAQPINEDKKGEPKPSTSWVKAVGIISEAKKGKTFYYAKTGQGTKWAKFGAPLYWDNFEGMTELEFKARADDAGEHVLPEGFYFAIQERNGKAYAIALAHKDSIEL